MQLRIHIQLQKFTILFSNLNILENESRKIKITRLLL